MTLWEELTAGRGVEETPPGARRDPDRR